MRRRIIPQLSACLRAHGWFALGVVAVTACAHAGASATATVPRQIAPASLPHAPITRPGYSNETSLAIDPRDPARVIASWQVPATVAWSADTGRTWQAAPLPDTHRWQLSGDPVVTFDADGHAYALYIAFDRPGDYDSLGRAAHRNGIFINRSDDGGRTWRASPTAVIQQPEHPGIPFEDKPQLAIDRSNDPARRGHVYVAWTEFRRWSTVILFARSSDGGQRFSAPIQISDRPGGPRDRVGADEGTSLGVAPDGTVYVTWSDSIGIWLDRSSDGGRTFGHDVLVAPTPDIIFDVPGVARANGYPSLALDPRTRRIYIEWQDVRFGRPEPLLATSDDGGNHWTAPRPIAPSDSAARFFAWMTTDQATGLVAVGYYRATDATHLQYMLATSTDAGAHFLERPWGDVFAPAGEFLGDYTGVDAQNGAVMGAWTEIERPEASGGPTGMGGSHHARVVTGRVRERIPIMRP